MTLHPRFIPDVPEDTVRVAKTAFRKGNRYMQMRDELGTLYDDHQFTDLFPGVGKLAMSPWRLALVSVMQFAENLTDRQAADAVRGRIDWKYALSLELDDEGFDFSVLSEFRGRLLENGAESRLFKIMLEGFQERGLLKARGRQRTDSTHILARVRELNRLEFVGETMRAALNALAEVAPEWLKGIVLPDWFERYSRPFSSWRLPQKATEQRLLGEQIGRDGIYLLTQIYASELSHALRTLPAVEFLRRAWIYQYYQDDDQTRWRDSGNLPPGALILSSPYDPEMRYSRKRDDTAWAGYKVHLTETCDLDYPHLITHVETTLATLADLDALDAIHQHLAAEERLPGQHLVDCGYVSAETLTHAQEAYAVDLFGPTRPDKSWQNKTEAAFDISQFSIDFEHESVTCPQGHPSQGWKLGVGFRGKPAIRVWFPRRICRVCPVQAQCTTSPKGRQLLFPPRKAFLALQSARQRERTEAFREVYQKRSGIEGTISQAANALGMRRTRYCGLAKVHLQHLVTVTAMNLMRVLDWILEKPRSTTRKSAFARLAPVS